MASNLFIIVLLVVVSISLTSGYSLSRIDAVSKQDDESYTMATSDEELSMVVVEDLVKARRLLATVARSEVVVVSKAKSGSSSSKSSKKKHKGKKLKGANLVKFLIILAAVCVTIVVICVICKLYARHEAKKDQSIEQGTATEEVNASSETQTSETEDPEKVKRSLKTQTSETEDRENVKGSSDTQTSKTEDRV